MRLASYFISSLELELKGTKRQPRRKWCLLLEIWLDAVRRLVVVAQPSATLKGGVRFAVVKRAMKSGFIGLFLLRVVHRIPRDTPIHATLNSSLFLIGMVLANHWLMKSHWWLPTTYCDLSHQDSFPPHNSQLMLQGWKAVREEVRMPFFLDRLVWEDFTTGYRYGLYSRWSILWKTHSFKLAGPVKSGQRWKHLLKSQSQTLILDIKKSAELFI